MTNHLDIAGMVLAKAALLDHRIDPTKDAIRAWAECFDLAADIWPRESLDAVCAHYSQRNPFQIMPGDVIDYCRRQPAWSSREHAVDFLDKWANHPYATVIEAYTGIAPPEIDVPDGLGFREEKAFRAEHLRAWMREHLDELADALLARRHRSGEIES